MHNVKIPYSLSKVFSRFFDVRMYFHRKIYEIYEKTFNHKRESFRSHFESAKLPASTFSKVMTAGLCWACDLEQTGPSDGLVSKDKHFTSLGSTGYWFKPLPL